MTSVFAGRQVSLEKCLSAFHHWLANELDYAERDRDLGKLDGVAGVCAAVDKAFGEYNRRVRELGIILGMEHEFVSYAEGQVRYQELVSKAGALMRDTVEREQRRSNSAIVAQAGTWLAR